MFAKSHFGNEILCESLRSLGIDTVFGIPGTQNILMFEGFRESGMKVILSMSETSAGFMANGYYRASGKPSAIAVIPGPGVTYALTGIAEARHDSAALLCLIQLDDEKSPYKFRLQEMDLKTLFTPVVKRFIVIDSPDQIAEQIGEAYYFATSGEPGPVAVAVTSTALCEKSKNIALPEINDVEKTVSSTVEEASEILRRSKRPLILAGQGAFGASDQIQTLIEKENIPIVTTCSGRGLIDENHPHSLSFEYGLNGAGHLNDLIDDCDYVLAVGCKFSHNGTAGFKLKIPPEKLIYVDASPESLDSGNYPAFLKIKADAKDFMTQLLEVLPEIPAETKTGRADFISRWKTAIEKIKAVPVKHQPKIPGWPDMDIARFFRAVNHEAAFKHIFVTDSGFHQTLSRKYLRIMFPRQLIVPADFQSIGYGLPAGIGAKAACPEKNVIVFSGDGSFSIMALELAGAVRENLPLGVIIFNDGYLGSIRLQQINAFGLESKVSLRNPDYKKLAESLGINYYNSSQNGEESLKIFLDNPGVRILEIELKDCDDLARTRKVRRVKESIGNSAIGRAAKKIISVLKGKSGKKN